MIAQRNHDEGLLYVFYFVARNLEEFKLKQSKGS